MTEPTEPHLAILQRRNTLLEAELDRLRRTRSRHRNSWLAVPVVIVATWTLSAQAPGGTSDLESRVSALERLIRKGPGNVTQVSGPFEVVGAANAPILVVTGEPMNATSRLGRIHIARGTGNNFYVKVIRADGQLIAQMQETNEGVGSVDVFDAAGARRADLWGKNGLNVYAPGDKPSITLAPDQSGAGVLRLHTAAGLRLAELGPDPNNGGGGALSVMGSGGKTTAAILGGLRGSGAVIVATGAGRPAAEMSISGDGRGMVQIFGAGQRPSPCSPRQRTTRSACSRSPTPPVPWPI